MSVINTPPPVANPTDIYGQPVSNEKLDNYLTHGKGFLSWALTLDHKRIGIMYMVGVLATFLLGGIFAVLLRTELIWAGQTLPHLIADTWTSQYNQMFTLHGAVMTFLFIIPAIPAILGNFVLPIMLGAKDVAFPKLNLASFHIYVLGSLFFVWILVGGLVNAAMASYMNAAELAIWMDNWGWLFPYGLDTGWVFYTPYSTSKTTAAVVPATIGVFILGFSSILTGLNFIASIHMLRPKGMTWFRLPLFAWALYATALIQILATPVLAITLLLLAAERLLQIGIFDPALGGDPVLYQHFFWFYSHPAVYIMVLPALGVISETIGVMCRKHIFGYNFIALSSVAIALFGFLVWGHHMFTSGQSALANALFSLITFSVSIPSAVKVFNWLSTMYGGSIRLNTVMYWVLGSILVFTIGGLTGLHLGTLSTDIHLHDTYFVVAHFHYVMMGTVLFSLVAGMYYWWPKIFGVMFHEGFGKLAAIVTIVGFNLAFFIQFILGAQGMPRRYASYEPQYEIYHQISTWGAFLMGLGLFLVLGNWLHSIWYGKKAPANPWGANTLEWQTTSPPPHDNFKQAPTAGDPYDLKRWRWEESTEEWVLKDDAVRSELQAVKPNH
ncbi:MAG: cbb3-type cytochrome c oxidase subunit I [Planctomycetota bacterium]